MMPKKDLNKTKAETVVIKGTITKNQKEIIRRLIGIVGSNEQDVIGKIIVLWLYNEGYLKKLSQDRQN
jgi:RNA-binding protein YhbY